MDDRARGPSASEDKGGKAAFSWRREIAYLTAVCYFAAVTEIIALRGGPGITRNVQVRPFVTTVGAFRAGLWASCYHVLGNLIWFVPMGAFLSFRVRKWYAALLLGALFSALLEAGQYVLGTGMTDIDDVILNALGALLGFCFMKLTRRWAFYFKEKRNFP